jgi:cytosine/adenosine deaminase-related metal-dependent hydrolase
MGVARRRRPALSAPRPVILHSAPLVLPVATEPIRDGAVAVRGERVLDVGRRDELRARLRVTEEHRWPGMIVAGLVDAYASPGPPGPGVVARAADLVDPAAGPGIPGVSYVRVTCESERDWEERSRDALITTLQEAEPPAGIAPRTRDPHVLEDLAVLARTFGLRLLVDLDHHSPLALDEAGALGPHCHAVCARPLDPGERKLLRLRGTTVAIRPGPATGEFAVLAEEGNRLALATSPLDGDLLARAAGVRDRLRELGLRPRGLERALVEAATLGGARALGLSGTGSLRPGGRASFAVFDARGRDPYAALLSGAPCLATVADGRHRAP